MIIVIGKSGQLANELKALLSQNVVCLGKNDIEITNPTDISKTLSTYSPSAIINASAYTAVDKAETDHEAAFAINANGVKHLGDYCARNNIPLVHVSTDYVFNGRSHTPIAVDTPRDPLGTYGKSKAAGEEALEQIPNLKHCIIRTAWVYSVHGNNFVHTMLRLMKEKPSLGVVSDQIGSPTWARGLAEACIYAAENAVTGTHHWTDMGVASWYDFAIAIQRIGVKLGLLEKAIPINPINTEDFPTPAARPAYSVLDKRTLKSQFASVSTHHWEAQLEAMMASIKP